MVQSRLGGVSGSAVLVTSVGAVLAYSGLKGKSITQTVQLLIQGKNPSTAAQATSIDYTPGTVPAGADPSMVNPGTVPGTTLPSIPGVTGGSTAANIAIAYARGQIGKPYVWGATGPNGFDCSGLVQTSYKAAGVNLPRTTYQQVFSGTAVTKAELIPGDLIFPDAGHVQIYTGGGNVVEAPQTGFNVREVPMWGFWKARRVA